MDSSPHTEICSYCHVEYAYPVEYHHTSKECMHNTDEMEAFHSGNYVMGWEALQDIEDAWADVWESEKALLRNDWRQFAKVIALLDALEGTDK